MSVSIYYSAVRDHGLNDQEQAKVTAVINRYSVNDQIRHYLQTGEGLNWESFALYETTDSEEAIIEGATKLPDNSEDAMWLGLQHWCNTLTELRRLIPNAEWQVNVDDHDIHWDEVQQIYDPSI